MEDLPEIITNAEYVGSGEYGKTDGEKTRGKTRYDYFETDATISGKPYVVSFDVEVHPEVNNYRTHKITKIGLTPETDRTAPAAAVSVSESVPTVNLPQQTEAVNQNLSTNAAVDKNGNDLTTREGAAAAMAQRKQAEAEKRNNAGSYQNTAPAGTAMDKLGIRIAGDQGDFLYVGMVIASLLGTGYVTSKRKEF